MVNLSKEWITSNCKVYENGQLHFVGCPIGTVKNEEEKQFILKNLEQTANNPQHWGVEHPFQALKKLKAEVKNRKCFSEGAYYTRKFEMLNRIKHLEYSNTNEFHCIIVRNHNSPEEFLSFSIFQILDACAEFNLGRDIEYVKKAYFQLDDSPYLYDDLKLLHHAWGTGKLDKIIKWVCSLSKTESGFIVHLGNGGRVTIKNEYLGKYISV